MHLTYLMFVVALCLSAIAEFYSIAGLAAIFAGAVVPIVIMGVVLGVAKLSITVWLHEYWNQARLLMKTYLVSAVVVLMFLTSMGIFGFLSKAHIEQVGAGQENAAQLQRIEVELKRYADIVAKAEERARVLETTGTGADANVNSQINAEQKRIESATARVQPAIDEQQRIIDAQTKIYADSIAKIDEQSANLQKFIDAKEVDKVQSLVGVKADGDWGQGTARAVTAWKAARAAERNAAVAKLEEANRDPTIKAARDEILRIRKTVETQVAESNKLIDRLRSQLGKTDNTNNIEILVNEQQDKIKEANIEIEALTKKKYELESEYRKLEVEVGPVKYIAELVYGQADQTVLEKAVRWVILLIVAVFDPLAVMMLLAATESMTWRRKLIPPPPKVEESVQPESEPAQKKTEPIIDVVPVVRKKRIRKWRRKKFNQINNEPVVEEDAEETLAEKEARRIWKAENPGQTIKEQKKLLAHGEIDRLPWEDYLQPLIEADNDVKFGTDFPANPVKGEMFVKSNTVPTRLFKYNGNKWIEVDKDKSSLYAYNDAYIEYLVDKISSGEYDTDLLTEVERTQIESKLKQ